MVAEAILPEGPSHNKIEPGDILATIDGALIAQFNRLDDILDSNVGNTIHIQLQRRGVDVEVHIKVGDLYRSLRTALFLFVAHRSLIYHISKP